MSATAGGTTLCCCLCLLLAAVFVHPGRRQQHLCTSVVSVCVPLALSWHCGVCVRRSLSPLTVPLFCAGRWVALGVFVVQPDLPPRPVLKKQYKDSLELNIGATPPQTTVRVEFREHSTIWFQQAWRAVATHDVVGDRATITGLKADTRYDVRVTYVHPDRPPTICEDLETMVTLTEAEDARERERDEMDGLQATLERQEEELRE